MTKSLVVIALIGLVVIAISITVGSLVHTTSQAREDDWLNTKSPSGKCYEVFQKARGSVGYHFVMFEKPCS